MSYLPGVPRTYRLRNVSLNAAVTDVGTFVGLPASYRIVRLMGFNASLSLTLATFSLYTGAGGTGSAIVNIFALAALTGATKFVDATLAITDAVFTSSTLYLRNITAQGAPATADFLLEYIDLAN